MRSKETPAVQPNQFISFGQLLRFLRERAGLTQRELSIAVGYSESQISRLENNQRAPAEATLAARFVPALHIEYEREWAVRLFALGAASHSGDQRESLDERTPVAARRLWPHPLPAPLTSFIGRETEVALVKQRLADTRLVTLTGSGGCGKTRLALQVAGDLQANYADGVWWLELAPVVEPNLIPQVLATALGVREEMGQPLLTTVTDFLRGKRVLLVLDNCEHLIEACVQLIEALLRAGPQLRILATSRELLGIAGEATQRIPSLNAPRSNPLPALTELLRLEAVRLFVERAVAAQPRFTLTPQNAPAVAQICQRLDGIPLAIELAATRVRVLSVEQIAARLDDRFHLLTGGGRTALPRQQTLRATMDWSHSLLTEPERLLFRRLAVFSSSWTLEAAEAVCVGEGLKPAAVLDALTRLVDKSLVQTEDSAREMRYSRLETIRQYAWEKLLDAQETEWFCDRHLNFYLSLAEQAEPWLDFGQEAEWHPRLEADQDNLRAALEWACERHPETARRLAGLLRWFWVFGDYLTEARAWYTQTLSLADLTQPTKGAAFALQGAGMAAAFLYLFGEAFLPLEQSAAIWRQLDDKPRLAECLWLLGYCYSSLGKNAQACELFAANEALFRQSASPAVLATVLGHWSLALVNLKQDYPAAKTLLDESLALACAVQNPSILGSTFMGLGYLSVGQGDYAAARRHYLESLAWRREAETRWLIAASLQHVADAMYLQSDYQAAQPMCEEALALTRTLGDRLGEAAVTIRLGFLAANTAQYAAAAGFFAASLEISRARFYPPIIVHSVLGYAHLRRLQGQLAPAVRLLACIETYLHFSQQPLYPIGRIEYERGLAVTRAQLSEAEFATAWEIGHDMSMEQAISYALEAANV